MMAEGENNCNGECSEIYPTQNEHIKQRVGILGSKGQFCAAFYHVHQWGNRPRYCLDETNCIIGHRATIENNPSVQAKTVVAVVKFENENGNILYEARYQNCAPTEKHAEDFFEQDIENGELGEQVEANPNGTITLYLTYQPCNKSTGTAITNSDQSCCTILLEIYQNILLQHNICLCVKAANTCRLTVNDQDANEDVDEEIADGDNNDVKDEKYRKNAVRGIKRLMRIGVNVSGMIGNDWDYLLAMTNPDVPRNYHARRERLDNSVQQTFTAIQEQLN